MLQHANCHQLLRLMLADRFISATYEAQLIYLLIYCLKLVIFLFMHRLFVCLFDLRWLQYTNCHQLHRLIACRQIHYGHIWGPAHLTTYYLLEISSLFYSCIHCLFVWGDRFISAIYSLLLELSYFSLEPVNRNWYGVDDTPFLTCAHGSLIWYLSSRRLVIFW